MTRAWTWEQLATATLRRQFPRIRGRGEKAVVELVRRVGPIQSQVARSPFVTVSSRLPGASHDAITAAYESWGVVRGSNLRGTVHTCAREHHPLLDTITRRTMANGWRNHLRLTRHEPADVQAGIEAFATGDWRSPDQLREYLIEWLADHEGAESAERARTTGVGRSFAHIHSAMIRRPLVGGGWDGQSTPGYRLAREVLDEPRSPWLDDADGALVALARHHLAAYGPANRRDIAWWTGEGLRHVDAALVSLGDELTERPGPDGQTYYDLADPPANGSPDPGARLLPEFDAVLVGYDPKSRTRFLDPDHVPHIWAQQNGMFSSSVLSGGRLVASWRFAAAAGNRPERRLEVQMFPDQTRLAESDLADQVAAVEAALAIRVTDLSIS